MKRLILPPHWLLLSFGAQLGLHFWLPVREVIPGPVRWVGVAAIAVGLALGTWSTVLFRRGKTGIVPFSESTTVVETGPYRFTRNPIYLGMALLLLGAASVAGCDPCSRWDEGHAPNTA